MTRRSNIGSKVNHRVESEPVTIEMEPNVNYLDATPLPFVLIHPARLGSAAFFCG